MCEHRQSWIRTQYCRGKVAEKNDNLKKVNLFQLRRRVGTVVTLWRMLEERQKFVKRVLLYVNLSPPMGNQALRSESAGVHGASQIACLRII